jgi:hypothetical protein
VAKCLELSVSEYPGYGNLWECSCPLHTFSLARYVYGRVTGRKSLHARNYGRHRYTIKQAQATMHLFFF